MRYEKHLSPLDARGTQQVTWRPLGGPTAATACNCMQPQAQLSALVTRLLRGGFATSETPLRGPLGLCLHAFGAACICMQSRCFLRGPRAKDARADAHLSAAVENGLLHVARHSHTQLKCLATYNTIKSPKVTKLRKPASNSFYLSIVSLSVSLAGS